MMLVSLIKPICPSMTDLSYKDFTYFDELVDFHKQNSNKHTHRWCLLIYNRKIILDLNQLKMLNLLAKSFLILLCYIK